MALVDYSSDSDSATETSLSAPKPAPAKPTFQKVTSRSEPKKIQVDLPTLRPEPGQQAQDAEEARPAKRARTSGGGFNSMLPAPKGRVGGGQSALKAGVSLKTSGEAAFSRAPVDAPSEMAPLVVEERDGDAGGIGEKKEEPTIVGKATKFRPLSVANKKKKPVKKPKSPEEGIANGSATATPQAEGAKGTKAGEGATKAPAVAEAPAPKPKRSLFSVQTEEADAPEPTNGGTYEAFTTKSFHAEPETATTAPSQPPPEKQPIDPNSLHSVASDLNLTSAERRQLFGRGHKNGDINITHFNIDAEYASNSAAIQAGEAIEHRAVKSIAPGKHSLQQLVNNARTQQGGLEDKWAEGRERGEAGGKYGWGGK